MNVVEIINEAVATGRTRFAFELLPPLKGDGMQKIFAAVEPLMDFDPAYVNITFHREGIKETEREDGSIVVDAISTAGGCIPRNVAISVGLSLVKFGALTLHEFVVKPSVHPARPLRQHARGHLSEGAADDSTVFDYDRQQAVETIVAGKSVMKNGEITGTGITLVTTKAGIPAAERNGFKWIETEFESPEPERYIP